MMDWGYGMGGGGWLLMTLTWLLLIVAVVALVAWLLPRGSRPGTGGNGEPTALDVLDARLARGEVDLETYRSLRAELTKGSRR